MRSNARGEGIGFLKPIGYAIAVLLFAVFDSTVSPRIGFFGTTPSLCLALTASAAVFDGKKTGAAVGLASGVVTHALGGVGVSVLPIAYTLLGWFLAAREHGIPRRDNTDHDFLRRFLNFAACLPLCCVAGMVVTAVSLLLSAGKFNIFSVFAKILIPEALGTFVYGFPIGIVRIAARKK